MNRTPGRTALLVTGHFYQQGRRGSMHWLADELAARGWNVRFLSFGYSMVSRIVGDVRLKALKEPPRKGRYRAAGNIEQIYHSTLFHPIDLRIGLANQVARPMFGMFPALWRRRFREAAQDADLIVLESGLPLMLAPMARRVSRAKLVYRVNDDIRVMRVPPLLRPLEMRHAPLFDRISLASPVLAERFRFTGKVGLDPMGLDKTAFEGTWPDPYAPRWEREVVCAGTSHFDADSVRALAAARPDWRFHIIGRLRAPVEGGNIVTHGEMPFRDVIPYVQHADFGLAPYQDMPGLEYQVHHSNRLKQYAFCRLPTFAPMRMTHPDAPYLIGYTPGDAESMEAALARAVDIDREHIGADVQPWGALAEGILELFE